MKRAEKESRSGEIARKLARRDLVSKCRRVVLLGKLVHRKTRDCSTHVKWEYLTPPFKIFLESGHYSLGTGEEIKVIHNGEEVLLAYDDAFKESRYAGQPSIEVRRKGGRNNVGFYKPGDWEDEIDRLLKDVPEGEERRFKESFPVSS